MKNTLDMFNPKRADLISNIILQKKELRLLEEMADSMTGVGNIPDESGASWSARNLGSAKKNCIDGIMSKGLKDQLKEFPMAKAGII